MQKLNTQPQSGSVHLVIEIVPRLTAPEMRPLFQSALLDGSQGWPD